MTPSTAAARDPGTTHTDPPNLKVPGTVRFDLLSVLSSRPPGSASA